MVLEYNCRLGDPETQAIMMRMDFDLAAALDVGGVAQAGHGSSLRGNRAQAFAWSWLRADIPDPSRPEKKLRDSTEAAALNDVAVFHAGTKREGDSIVTSGGRVLGVTALADTLPQAIHKAYEAVGKIDFEGAHCRTDIGAKGDLRKSIALGAPRG